MIHVTARQLQQLHATGLPIVLPYRAKLTPLARDFVRQRKIQLGYADVPELTLASVIKDHPSASAVATGTQYSGGSTAGLSATGTTAARASAGSSKQAAIDVIAHAVRSASTTATESANASSPVAAGSHSGMGTGNLPTLWWCQGNCGAAKAALTMAGQSMPMAAIELPGEPRHTAQVIKAIAKAIAGRQAQAAVIVVPASGLAALLANRHPAIRAVVANNLGTLDAAMETIAPNVLILETAGLTLMLARNLMLRFLKHRPQPSTDLQKLIEEASRCA